MPFSAGARGMRVVQQQQQGQGQSPGAVVEGAAEAGVVVTAGASSISEDGCKQAPWEPRVGER